MAETLKEYRLGITVTLELEIPVKAKDFPDAAEAYKSKKLSDFITVKSGVDHNDSSHKLRSISFGEWMNGQ